MLFNHHVLVERVEIVISVELVEQVNESRQLFLLTDVVILVRLIALEWAWVLKGIQTRFDPNYVGPIVLAILIREMQSLWHLLPRLESIDLEQEPFVVWEKDLHLVSVK